MSAHRLLLSVGLCLVLLTAIVVYRDLKQVREQRDRVEALSSGNVPLEAIADEPSPFLEDQLLTGAPEHAHLVEGDSAAPAFDLLASEGPEIDVLTGETPSELPKVEEVDPVPLLPPDRRKENIAAIKEVLPDISEERLEFWLEETRDMPPEMIRDMLTLRKHFGALSESFSGDQPARALIADKPAQVVTDPMREMLLAARALVLQNKLNERSLGYLATELVFVENRAGTAGGVRLAETSLKTQRGHARRTERPLDFSIQHPDAFLLVYENGQPRLTKYGRLKIGPGRQLYLAIEGTELLVAPKIVIPDGVEKVAVSAAADIVIPDDTPQLEGEHWKLLGKLELMTVREPAYLQPVGAACYVPTRRSGLMTAFPATHDPESRESELVVPGTLQESNVDPQQEGWQLEQIDRWLKLLEDQKSGALPPNGASPQPKSYPGMQLDIF